MTFKETQLTAAIIGARLVEKKKKTQVLASLLFHLDKQPRLLPLPAPHPQTHTSAAPECRTPPHSRLRTARLRHTAARRAPLFGAAAAGFSSRLHKTLPASTPPPPPRYRIRVNGVGSEPRSPSPRTPPICAHRPSEITPRPPRPREAPPRGAAPGAKGGGLWGTARSRFSPLLHTHTPNK